MIQLISGIIFAVTLVGTLILALVDRFKKRLEITDPAVSVIIPCYNDADSIEETIFAVYKALGRGIDLIVIDDASSDASYTLLSSLQKKYSFRLFQNSVNKGKSSTLNAHSHLAKYQTLIFLDADVVINKKAIHDALVRLQRDTLGAVSCPYRPKNKGFLPLMQHFEYNMMRFLQGSYNLTSAISLWGGCIVIQKKAFEKAGKFSLHAITEDMYLAFKLNELGYRVEQSFYPILTYVPETFASWWRQKIRWASGGLQAFIDHWKVWIKNPIHIFFLFSLCIFMTSMSLGIAEDIVFWQRIGEYFSMLNDRIGVVGSVEATVGLYGVTMLKDLAWTLAFSLPSMIYAYDLVTSSKKWYMVLFAVPFSLLYIPLFTLNSLVAIVTYLVQYKRYRVGKRAW